MKRNPHIKEDPDTFILNNMDLAYSIAWRFIPKSYNQGLEKDDIISIATIGLIKAYEKFNPTKFKGENGNDIKFSTYAVPVITSEIHNNIRNHYDLISIPRPMKETSVKIRKAGYVREDNPIEISEKLNIPLKLVKSGMEILDAGWLDSLDRSVSYKESKGSALGTLIVGTTSNDLDNEIIINDFLSLLDDKMLEVYKYRFLHGLSQREVSEVIGCGQVSVSRIEKKIFQLAEMYCGDIAC